MNQPKARALAPVAVLGALLVALGPALAAPDAIAVDLSGAPVGRVHVQVDGTVTFRALAGEHEIAAEDGSWWTGRISEGTGATLRFEAIGEFPFVCLVHADETGTVVVEPRQDDPPPPPPVNAAPSARFLAPGDGATVTGTVPVRIGGEDPDGGPEPITMRVRVDGGAWMTVLAASANEWQFGWNAEAAGAGEHTFEAVASDGAAESAVATIRVKVDAPEPPPRGNERPTVAITRPAANARLVPSDVLVTGTAADADSPESALLVEVSVDGGPWQRARGGSDWVFVWDASVAAAGPHTIAARASDEDSTSAVARMTVTIGAIGRFTPSTPAPPTDVESESNAWREAALDFGWVAIALVALSGAWAWASSRP